MKIKLFILTLVVMFSLNAQAAFAQYDDLLGKETTVESITGFVIVHTGASRGIFNAMIDTLMAASRPGYLALQLSHNSFSVQSGTKVILLWTDLYQNTAKVKIKEGSYAGKTGWVLLNDLNKEEDLPKEDIKYKGIPDYL